MVEVTNDYASEGRLRHGTALLRWRSHKAPRQCTREQMQEEARPGLLVKQVSKHDRLVARRTSSPAVP